DGKWVYFRANDLKPNSYAIHRWEIATGKHELVFGEEGLWDVADHEGKKLLLRKETGALTAEIYEWDEDAKKLFPLFGQNEKEEYDVAYAKAPGEVLVQTPKFGEFRRLWRTKGKPKTGGPLEQADVVAITPDVKHDIAGFFVDRQRAHVYTMTNE